jgi:low temperature requirement protein LtrA
VLQFPGFVGGQNHTTARQTRWSTSLLHEMVLQHFAPLGAALPNAVFVPLGLVPTKVMNWLVRQGHLWRRSSSPSGRTPEGP